MRTIKLLPSDLSFLSNGCLRCFWLKYNIHRNVSPIRMPFHPLFNVIDEDMKEAIVGKNLKEFGEHLPDIDIIAEGALIKSAPMVFPELDVELYFNAKPDVIGKWSSGFVVPDFKTTQPKTETVMLYSDSLHAYGYTLSRPAEGPVLYKPINRFGLLVFDPKGFGIESGDQPAVLRGNLTWLEVPIDTAHFKEKMRNLAILLATDAPPEAHPQCAHCNYVKLRRELDL